jgi:7tm Chemosensory receptor
VYHVSSNNTIARKIFDTSILALRSYPTSTLVLWFASVLHLTWSLESVRCQVEEMATKRLMLTDREICTRIHGWMRSHVTICQTVESLNCCFGFFTLIEIPCIFAIFIANAFGLLFVTIEGRSAVLHVSYSVILLQHFTHLLVITNAADRMSNEVYRPLFC